jgi:threonine efflux protein
VTWGSVLIALKIVGGLYLLWLAYRAGRATFTTLGPSSPYVDRFGVSYRQLYLQGVAMHLTNPKAIFSWAATISVGLPNSPSVHDVLIGLSGCFCLGILTFAGYAFVFSTVFAQRAFAIAGRWLEGTMVVVYGYAGVRLLFSKT